MRKRLELSVQVAVTEGGGSEVLIVYGFDSYNQATEEEMAQPLRSHGGGRYNAQSNRVP